MILDNSLEIIEPGINQLAMSKHPGLDCILLVDDDRPTNFIHKKVIQYSGVDTHVHACESGECAMNYLESSEPFQDDEENPRPGIVFLDINMPGMNGWEFLDRYEQLPKEKKENVVLAMLTTSINPEDMKMAEENDNVHSFFSKPLKQEYIDQLINEKFS